MVDAKPSSSSQGAAANATTVIVTTRQLNIQPLSISDDSNDSNDTALRWDKWKRNIERQFRFFGLEDTETKKDGLLIYGGQKIADLEDTLPDLPNDNGANVYTQMIKKLDKHFLPRKNKDYARFQFGNLTQNSNESMAKHYARIRENEPIRDQVIKTMTNSRLRGKAIRHNWTLTQILDEAAIEEETNAQASEIDRHLKGTTNNPKIKFIEKKKQTTRPEQTCQQCGSKHEKRNCKAYGVERFKCDKRNHYARMCSTPDPVCTNSESRKQQDRQATENPSPSSARHAPVATANSNRTKADRFAT